jgi:hypothetical protein
MLAALRSSDKSACVVVMKLAVGALDSVSGKTVGRERRACSPRAVKNR